MSGFLSEYAALCERHECQPLPVFQINVDSKHDFTQLKETETASEESPTPRISLDCSPDGSPAHCELHHLSASAEDIVALMSALDSSGNVAYLRQGACCSLPCSLPACCLAAVALLSILLTAAAGSITSRLCHQTASPRSSRAWSPSLSSMRSAHVTVCGCHIFLSVLVLDGVHVEDDYAEMWASLLSVKAIEGGEPCLMYVFSSVSVFVQGYDSFTITAR